MANHKPVVELFRKYIDGTITPAELEELSVYLDKSKPGDELTEWLSHEMGNDGAKNERLLVRNITEKVEKELFDKTAPDAPMAKQQRTSWLPGSWLRVAAAVLLCTLAVGGLLWHKRTPTEVPLAAVDITPGGHRAQLTLPDGTVIDLDRNQDGIAIDSRLTYLDGTAISDIGNHIEQPDGSGTERQDEKWLTLTTPRGGMYQVKLADGTVVWLNAGSVLRYPVEFTGTRRTVELLGEAYFEVARNEKQPFVVYAGEQVVNVLGTAFNINAYEDEEAIKTTLVSGSVELFSNVFDATFGERQTVVLNPGQQAVQRGGSMQVIQVDVKDHMAWKNGRFVFYGVSLPVVIRQIERWYDVTFEYDKLPDNIEVWGGISRNVMLSEILEAIEMNTTLEIKQQGRRVIMREK